MQKQPYVVIILLNYKNYSITIDCLKSLNAIDYDNYSIVVVDNDSQNGSYEKLKNYENSKIHIIQSGCNGGFAYGNNIGIEYAKSMKADYYLLLNNDTIVETDFLKKMIAAALNDKRIGIVTCRIMYESARSKVWYAGGEVDWNNLRAKHKGFNEDYYEHNIIEDVSFVSGCCMLISKVCYDTIGGLPEDYFMYYEDLDYSIMATNNKFLLKYVSSACIYHCVSSSSGGANSPFVIEWENRSRRKFYKKYKFNMPKNGKVLIAIKCEIVQLIKILIRKNKIKAIKAYKRSYNKL